MKANKSNGTTVVTGVLAVLGLLWWGVPRAAQGDHRELEVRAAVRHAVSPRLTDVVPRKEAPGQRVKPVLKLPPPRASAEPFNLDPALQTTPGLSLQPSVANDFVGLGQHFPNFTVNAIPPDANAAVGATQIVQWVNTSFVVLDKQSGANLYGPAAGNTLWQPFLDQAPNDPCANNNDGDPIVQYDKAAGRWVMTQLVVTGGPPYYQCVAVSATSDATGSYNLYEYSYDAFPDYGKLGAWPDAYYFTANMFRQFGPFFIFLGAEVCAYDRQSMLLGNAASQQCFQLSSSFGGLLPADLDGRLPPPDGSPNFLLNLGSNALNLWKFHVDWAVPANTTLSGPASIPVAAFSLACNGGACIDQKDVTQKLDSIGDRLMYRLAYRNFGDHESLVANHSVQVNAYTGVRWYELRAPNGSPVVFQQGTYAPDANFRWMGSLSMDKAGDMAMGYSVSSSTMYPSIRYTGRTPNDTPNTMEAEAVSISGNIYGSGSQTTFSRWGDYTSLSIDPVDDCTFWYTNEYLLSTGVFNWDTRVFSFKFPNCQ